MGFWKTTFERSAEAVPDRAERCVAYRFGPPASDTELEMLSGHLGSAVPSDLRAMLQEFNGIEIRDKYWGASWQPLYLSVDQMLHDVPEYVRTSGNPIPPSEELANVAFFAHQNGFAELYGVCLRAFSSFGDGDVLVMDHDTGEFDRAEDSLMGFVGSARYCEL